MQRQGPCSFFDLAQQSCYAVAAGELDQQKIDSRLPFFTPIPRRLIMSAPRTCCYVFIFACALCQGIVRGDDQKVPPPKFTVSKETTYFVGPLDRDGYVDYVAAINQHYSRGVT